MRRRYALRTLICYQAGLRRSSVTAISCGYFPVRDVSSHCWDTRVSMFALIRSPSSSWCTLPLRIRLTKTSRGHCGRRWSTNSAKRCCPDTSSESAALGQTETSHRRVGTSGLGSEVDIVTAVRHVSEVPGTDVP